MVNNLGRSMSQVSTKKVMVSTVSIPLIRTFDLLGYIGRNTGTVVDQVNESSG